MPIAHSQLTRTHTRHDNAPHSYDVAHVRARTQVRLELFKDVVESSNFFFGVDEKVYESVCMCLVPSYKTEGMEVTVAGDIPDALYIVRFGVVSVTMHQIELFEAESGDVIGENALLGLTLDGRRQRTCIAKTMCELCKLNKKDFGYLLNIQAFRRPFRMMVQAHLANLEAALAHNLPLDPRMLARVDWTRIRKQIESAHRKKARPDGTMDAMTASIQRVISQHSSTNSDLLITNLQFIFKAIRFTDKSCSLRPSDSVVIAVAWPGFHERDDASTLQGLACREFSEVVYLGQPPDECAEGQFELELNAGLAIPIAHKTLNWTEMPPLRFVVYRVHDVDDFSAPEGHIPRLDDYEVDWRRPSSETLVKEMQAGLTFVASSTMSLKKVIKSRQTFYGDPYAKIPETTATRVAKVMRTLSRAMYVIAQDSIGRSRLEIEVSDNKYEAHTTDAVILAAVTVNREVGWRSRWRKLLGLIRRNAPSPWFLDQQRKQVNHIRRNVHTVFTQAELNALIGEDMDAPCKRKDLERVHRGLDCANKKMLNLTDTVSELTTKMDAIMAGLAHLGAPIELAVQSTPKSTPKQRPTICKSANRPPTSSVVGTSSGFHAREMVIQSPLSDNSSALGSPNPLQAELNGEHKDNHSGHLGGVHVPSGIMGAVDVSSSTTMGMPEWSDKEFVPSNSFRYANWCAAPWCLGLGCWDMTQ